MTTTADREVNADGFVITSWAVVYKDGAPTGELVPLTPGGSIIFQTPGGKLEAYIGEYGDLEVWPVNDQDDIGIPAVVARPNSSRFPDGLRLSLDRDEPFGRRNEAAS